MQYAFAYATLQQKQCNFVETAMHRIYTAIPESATLLWRAFQIIYSSRWVFYFIFSIIFFFVNLVF